MSVIFRAAVPADLEPLLALLDAEFVFGKGRTLSFQQRFPTVFSPENVGNILLAEENGKIISALAIRQFDWSDKGELFRGAMLGAVYTHPLRRGEGWGSRLLAGAQERMLGENLDFAVLWTTLPEIYARAGWVSGDGGLLGETEGWDKPAVSTDEVKVTPAGLADCRSIEAIRRYKLDSLTLRQAIDYRQLPLPAREVSLLHCTKDVDGAYALLGHNGDIGILYEMVGNPDRFHALWLRMRSQCRRLLINDQPGSASYRWLAQDATVVWQPKPLAMWLPLSGKCDIEHISKWYIPYFDRI